MALACDQDDVSALRDTERLGDGLAAAGDLGCSRRPGHDGGPDRRWVFAPGIVVGDNHNVRQPGRNLAHLRPFALVAISARAEHNDQAAFDVGSQRSNRSFECVGRVRVIDIDRDAGTADHRSLQPPAHGRNALHRREGLLPFPAGRQNQPRRGEHVRRLVCADQRQSEAVGLGLVLQLQGLAEGARALVDQLDGLALAADGQDLVPSLARPLDHFVRLGVVGPHHGRLARRKKLLEQPHLSFEIAFHRLVIVEMVAAEIGEGSRGERHALGAVLVEPVARRFIGDMAHPHALQTSHVVEEGDDVRRCQAGRYLVVGGRDPERPDRRRAMAAHAPDLACHFDRRSLAVGAGHRDHRLRVGRVIFRGELRKTAPRNGIADERDSFDLGLGPGDNRHGAATHRFADEIFAVEDRALEGPEHAAPLDLAMVDRKAGHHRIRINVRKVPQPHRGLHSFVS